MKTNQIEHFRKRNYLVKVTVMINSEDVDSQLVSYVDREPQWGQGFGYHCCEVWNV